MTGELIGQAVGAMRHNRRRTALTMLGMAWGIATVVLLLAYGAGFERAITAIFSSFGTKLIGVFPGRTTQQAGGAKAGAQIRFTLDTVDLLTHNVPLIKNISPEVGKMARTQHENRSFDFPVNGTYANFTEIRYMPVGEGRFFNDQDVAQRARVVVLGSESKERLFSGRPAIGQTVRLDGISFEVIGVFSPQMQEGNDDRNRQNFVPFTAMSDLKDTTYLNGIWMNYEGNEHERIENAIRNTLATHYGFKPSDRRAVYVANLMKDLTQFQIITAGLKVLLAFIGTLTLGIGGIGLMNIMLVSVQQRTREIGVEKALGARKRHILFQFLSEALVITFVGGIAGILLAYIVSFAVGTIPLYSAFATNAEDADIRLIIDPMTLLISTVILSIVGIVSGMLPAIRASRLDPIEALRYE